MYTEKEFKEHVEITKRILKDTYVNNIIYVQDRVKAGAAEDELKQIDELILANERMIVYFDEGDQWVKDLHAEAKGEIKENGDGTSDGLGVNSGDAEEEVARIEEARNS